MMRTYAIGDTHGCYYTLLALLNKLPLERQDKLIFLGDYIDRGNYSNQVVEYVKSMTDSGQAIALMGNHERMCIDANGGSGYWQQVWTQNGGYNTLDSYDTRTEEEKIIPPAFDTEKREVWNSKLPRISEDHIKWMMDLPLMHEDDKFYYVHAGFNPLYTIEQQTSDDMLWIRNKVAKFERNWGKIVVFGHDPFEKPLIMASYIGLDTGCVYGNYLSAMCMETRTLFKAEHDDRDGQA